MACKDISAEAFVRLVSGVDLRMSLQIVSANEALVAVVTLVLTISKVGLNMGLDILLSAKSSVTAGMQANPLAILGIRTRYVGGDFINANTCFGD